MAEGKEKKQAAPVWDVDAEAQDFDIVLIFKRGDTEYHLTHSFREPSAADKMARMRYLSRTKIDRRNRGVVETDYPGANDLLWSRCIKDVSGYSVNKDSGPTWKSKIPIDHKSAAVEKLLAECGLELDEDDAKN